MSHERTEETEFTPISEQASHWWVLLHSESVTAAEHREFGDWVARSPEHIAAFLRTARLLRALKSPDVCWPSTPVAELIREAVAAGAEIVPLHGEGAGEPARVRTVSWRPLALAASILVASVVAWYVLAGPDTYRTALGEQRSVVLADGSVVTVNTSSEIEVDYRAGRRTVELIAGEALFQVASDPARPFDVIAGDTTVRAVGTQFNVDRRESNTTVTVVEGKVAVLRGSRQNLGQALVVVAAAERAVISASRLITPEQVSNVAAATAWTQRRLIFERRPLGEVAEEFNRYNRERIEIASESLRAQEVTGVFQANDPQSFVAFLSNIGGVVVQRTGEGIRIVAEEEGAAP